MGNPFSRQDFNLMEQMKIAKSDPGLAEKLREQAAIADAEAARQANTRSLVEFNQLDKAAKIKFIKNGGEVL